MKQSGILVLLLIAVLILQVIILIKYNTTREELEEQADDLSDLSYDFSRVNKNIDDIMWFKRLEDVAFVDKVELTGPPLGFDKQLEGRRPDSLYMVNPLRFQTYVFIPKNLEEGKKYPLLVLPHGGVHSNFGSNYSHIVAELIGQGYVVTAPEYRGSTGYGKRFYQSIDYGGLEIQDVKAARDYMLEAYDFLDENNVGILGWSHGGLITLMNLMQYPDSYKVGYAGVPVSDLVYRIGYRGERYERLYSAKFHVGKTVAEDTAEYLRRSPVSYVERLTKPLLIHTNTNDSDVYSDEVMRIIDALKAANKDFEYEVYEDLPGGHRFDRMDTRLAREIRLKIFAFLAAQLNPPYPMLTIEDLNKASYYRP